MPRPLEHLRICDFTGQLAGAGATRFLAACGAQVIRIEDPVMQGRWDILRGVPPFVDERRGVNLGGAFNNHNVEKLGITLNLRTEKGKEILRRLIGISDVVSENFAAGVLERWGFDYPAMKAIRQDIIYVSNCGFGHRGPYRNYKTWGPIVQATSGLTFSSGLPGLPPAGWGYSYMDHTGGYYMAIAILAALRHRNRTGEGQHVDLSCVEAAATLNGPVMLDFTVNSRPLRRDGMPNANRSQYPPMAPHGIYPCAGEDTWVAFACRSDEEWLAFGDATGFPQRNDERFRTIEARLAHEDDLDGLIASFTRALDRDWLVSLLRRRRIPAAAVQQPGERIDEDPSTAAWALWPTVHHLEMGEVRVDGLPVHFSATDWTIEKAGPCLGEDNDAVYRGILGFSETEVAALRAEAVI
jgi:crotonobetainyl-CoA:carnitine CoA-transferase CaiB-like acyl-CoA transferase